MKEFIILTVVFIGLALLVEIVYVILCMVVEAYFAKLYKEEKKPDVTVIRKISVNNVEVSDNYNDPFDLGVQVDKIRFGDEL